MSTFKRLTTFPSVAAIKMARFASYKSFTRPVTYTDALAAGTTRAPRTRRGYGGASQPGTIRSLHQYRRMRSRLPQGNQAGSDRQNEPRFSAGQIGRAGSGGRGLSLRAYILSVGY